MEDSALFEQIYENAARVISSLKKYMGLSKTSITALLSILVEPWRLLPRLIPFSWLTPQHVVRLFQTDGAESFWLGGHRLNKLHHNSRFVAIELPEDLILRRKLRLPTLSDEEIRAAIALDARSASPFNPLDLVWGHCVYPLPGGFLDVSAVLASRRLVSQHIQARALNLSISIDPEVWIRDTDKAIILPGFGEVVRLHKSTRGRRLAYLLMLVSFVLLVGVAITPTVQLQLQIAQAEFAYRELEGRTSALVSQREALAKVDTDLNALREQFVEHMPPLVVLDVLTQLVPDDTWLQRLQVQGSRVTMTGQTPNAATLMNALSKHALVRDVKAPAAAVRSMGGGKENFTVEFSLAPEALQPAKEITSPIGMMASTSVTSTSSTGTISSGAVPSLFNIPTATTPTVAAGTSSNPLKASAVASQAGRK